MEAQQGIIRITVPLPWTCFENMGRYCLSFWFKLQFCSAKARCLQIYHFLRFSFEPKCTMWLSNLCYSSEREYETMPSSEIFETRVWQMRPSLMLEYKQYIYISKAYQFLFIAYSLIMPYEYFVKREFGGNIYFR